MNERMTICNMSIEAGGKAGLIAPDDTTYEFLANRPFAPKGRDWDAGLEVLADVADRIRAPSSARKSRSTRRASARW